MKSTAHIKSHPAHPILVAFPIAFFTGTLICDLIAQLLSDNDFLLVASFLRIAGVIGGVVAAVPGFIDYLYTIPPGSSAKKRATLHMILNLTLVAIFLAAIYLNHQQNSSRWPIILLELAGFLIMMIAGWHGGTLVYRNQIGVDIRYANAGKWKEERFQESEKIAVLNSDELKVNQMKLAIVGDRRIVIALTEEGYVAFSDRCTHRGGSLAAGSMICGTVQCPWHGSQFNAKTGEVKAGPAKSPIQTFRITEGDGKVYLETAGAEAGRVNK